MANILDHWRNSCKPWLTTNKKMIKTTTTKTHRPAKQIVREFSVQTKIWTKEKNALTVLRFSSLKQGSSRTDCPWILCTWHKNIFHCKYHQLGEKTLADSSVQTHPTDIYVINYNSFSFPFLHELWAYFLSPLIPVFIRRFMQPHQKIEPISLHHNVRAEID